MKKFYMFIINLILVSNLFSAFEAYNWGSRAVGMGGSFVSICDDASSIVWNPAGLIQIQKIEFLLNYSKLYLGLDSVNINKNFFSFVVPTDIIPIGFSFFSLSSGETIKYSENSFVFSSAFNKKFKKIDLSLGVGLKWLWNSFDSSIYDPIIKNKSSNLGVSINLGFLGKTKLFKKDISFGFSSDLNEPDIGLSNEDLVKRKTLLGISLLEKVTSNISSILSTSILFYNGNVLWLAGTEFCFKNNLFLRCGYNYSDLNFGFGYNFNIKFLGNLGIDYSFSLPLIISDSSGSHNVSLKINFGKKLTFKRK